MAPPLLDLVRACLKPRILLVWLKRFIKAFLAYKYLRLWFPRKVKSVAGATVLVTGAGGGLGTCICKEFARRGVAKFVLWDVHEESLDIVASELRQTSSVTDVKTQKVNLAERDEIYGAAKSALDSVGGRIDVVVNNAGIVTGQNFLDTSDRQIEATMLVNAMAHMYMAKAFLPAMLKNQGGPSSAFLNVSSFASFMGVANMVDYSASKFAARGFAESFAAELKLLGLSEKCQICCVCPGHINTKLFKGFELLGSIAMDPEYVARKAIDGYETAQELVVLPRYSLAALPLVGLAHALGHYNIPNPRPHQSPLSKLDRKHSQDILQKMGRNTSRDQLAFSTVSATC